MAFVQNSAWRGRYLPFGWDTMTVAPVRLVNGRVVPATLAQSGMGSVVPCSTWLDSLLNTDCWSNSAANMAASVPPLPAPVPPLPPADLTTAPASSAAAQSTVDQLLQQNVAANQQNVLAAVQNWIPPNTNDSAAAPSDFFSSIPWWVWAAGGGLAIAVLGKVLR